MSSKGPFRRHLKLATLRTSVKNVDFLTQTCDTFYWKQCKIVFKQRTFNATSRQCKRQLRKDCEDTRKRSEQMYCSSGNTL
jgi:hypothetical protein